MFMRKRKRLLFLSPAVQAGAEREASMADFVKLKGLGKGAFGKVYKCQHKKSKRVFAIKQISKR